MNHTTNSKTLLDGIYFSPEFQDMRDRGKRPFKINQQSKDNLEQSIKRGTMVVKCNSGLNTALNDFGDGVGSNDENKAKKQP